MKWLKALIIGFVFVGVSYAGDTLTVNIVQPTQIEHKDTLEYWFSSGVSAIAFEDLKDSVLFYHPKVLNLYIYTYGGDPLVAIDFYYWLRVHGVKIRTYVGGLSASAGVIMFVWGDERYISPHGLLFVHQVSTWVFLEKYNPKSSENMAIALKTIQDDIEAFMADRTGVNKEKLHMWMVEEKWFDAKEALKSGLATGIIGEHGVKKKEDITNEDLFRWNSAP